MSSDCIWEHLILRSHAEATSSDETCKSTWKWSDEQDDWWCTWFVSIADWASAHWNDDEIDIHTEINQINMKSSLKREIQHSSFSIFNIKNDTLTSVTAQKSCKVLQHIIRLIASSRVLDSSRLDLSQNSWLKYLSQVRRFNSSIRVESEDWDRVSTRNFRLNSSRHEAKYY